MHKDNHFQYLMKKSTFLSKFHFFFFLHKINIFAPKLILTETLVILPLQENLISLLKTNIFENGDHLLQK